MGTSPQINHHMALSEALNKPNLTESSLSVTSLGDKDQGGLSYSRTSAECTS